MPCPVDGEGKFTSEVTDFSGRSVQGSNLPWTACEAEASPCTSPHNGQAPLQSPLAVAAIIQLKDRVLLSS